MYKNFTTLLIFMQILRLKIPDFNFMGDEEFSTKFIFFKFQYI